jgi:hypothetical protein
MSDAALTIASIMTLVCFEVGGELPENKKISRSSSPTASNGKEVEVKSSNTQTIADSGKSQTAQ